MTRALPGLSAQREESKRGAEAYAEGINAVLAFLVSAGDLDAARRVREHFSDRNEMVEAAE